MDEIMETKERFNQTVKLERAKSAEICLTIAKRLIEAGDSYDEELLEELKTFSVFAHTMVLNEIENKTFQSLFKDLNI